MPALLTEKTMSRAIPIASWLLIGSGLLLVLPLHLLPALLAGLLVFELVNLFAVRITSRWLHSLRAKWVAIAALALVVVSALALIAIGLAWLIQDRSGSLSLLFAKMAQAIEDSRTWLPAAVANHLPNDATAVRQTLVDWLRDHAGEVQLAGKEVGRVLVHVLIGMVIGALVALRNPRQHDEPKPLAAALLLRSQLLGRAFRDIVFAQVKISAVNTVLTAAYLVVLLPLFGIHLPLAKTLIAITFIAGLLPVIGNLISNTVIFFISVSQAPILGAISLGYLVIIHKLEYFLNAKIVGNRIRAAAWELLIAMLVMEAAFGIPGIIAAPIYYAYLKAELRQRNLI